MHPSALLKKLEPAPQKLKTLCDEANDALHFDLPSSKKGIQVDFSSFQGEKEFMSHVKHLEPRDPDRGTIRTFIRWGKESHEGLYDAGTVPVVSEPVRSASFPYTLQLEPDKLLNFQPLFSSPKSMYCFLQEAPERKVKREGAAAPVLTCRCTRNWPGKFKGGVFLGNIDGQVCSFNLENPVKEVSPLPQDSNDHHQRMQFELELYFTNESKSVRLFTTNGKLEFKIHYM